MLRPRFVHFAGYHSPEHMGPLLEDEKRGSRGVSPEVFADIFKARDGWIECLYFSTCYAGRNAEVLAKHVRHVVGMMQEVSDQVCVRFASEFYGAVFDGLGVSDAFESARRILEVEGRGDGSPVLFSNPRFLNAPPAVEIARQTLDLEAVDRKRILVLSANPTDTHQLEIDVEVRGIRAGLHAAGLGQQYYILHCPAVRQSDITREILAFHPEIVHFSGHGLRVQKGLAVAVRDEEGRLQSLDNATLTNFFKFLTGRVQCVLWNACDSAELASQIAAYVPCSIGYEGTISDKAAIKFAVEFYAAHGAGASLEASFELARAQLSAMDVEAATMLRLFIRPLVEQSPTNPANLRLRMTSTPSLIKKSNIAMADNSNALAQSDEISRRESLPNKRALRLTLQRIIITDSDLQAFLIDYFPEIQSLLSEGMDRSRKHNILLERINPEDIISALRDAYPDKL